ncbi:RPII140-upstream gene protein [Harpegnathos saltator]|uniref:Complex I assembly factor TIMMDC1, mitochondrial n=2 Tax=Harpegnathos saltator TaxID=610380 RepID=E2B6Y6_HARSA|nr:RPII140-upstream gene protein [Harpegnathos saltator]
MGWDRVKKIFCLNEEGLFTKELQSITNVTLTGGLIGLVIGGISATKNTINNFISSNEATRFINHFEAKKHLQREVFLTFVKKGAVLGKKLATFSFIFSALATCTTAYRAKIGVENYVFAGAVTGSLNRLNLGPRALLVGAGLGSTLGAVYGTVTVLLLYLTGTTIDEIMQVQQDWVISRNMDIEEKIRKYASEEEESEIKKLFVTNQEIRAWEEEYQKAKKESGS